MAHVPFDQPVCPILRGILLESCKATKATAHDGGVYMNMEGPAFSTKAESVLHRLWGATVIGMTAVTEAKLAREAEIPFALLAMVTDYDCWHSGHETVTVKQVVETMRKNVTVARSVLMVRWVGWWMAPGAAASCGWRCARMVGGCAS